MPARTVDSPYCRQADCTESNLFPDLAADSVAGPLQRREALRTGPASWSLSLPFFYRNPWKQPVGASDVEGDDGHIGRHLG